MEIEESAEATAKGTSTLIAQSVVSGIFRISNIMILTRLLPVEQMGQIAILAVIYGFMQFIGALGLNHATPLIIPKYEQNDEMPKVRSFLNKSVSLIFITSLFLIAVLWLLNPLIILGSALSIEALMLIMVVVPFSSLETFLDSFVLARYETTKLAVGRIIFDGTRMISSVLLVSLRFGLEGVIIGWLIAEVVAILAFGGPAIGGLPQKSQAAKMRPVLTFALPSLTFQIVDVTIQNTDRIILIQLTGLDSLGIYDVILSMLFMMSFVSLTIASSLYPMFSRIRLSVKEELTNRESKMSRVSTMLLRYTLLLLMPLAMIVALSPSVFLNFLFGSNYADFPNAPLVLSILVLMYALWGATYGLQTVLRAMGESRFFIYSGLVIIMFEIVGCYMLTALLGILGSAIIRAFYVLFLLLAALIRLRQRGVRIERQLGKSLSKISLASVISGLFVSFLNPSNLLELIAWSLIGLFLYILILFIIRVPSDLDFRLAKALLPRFMEPSLSKLHTVYLKE